MLSGIASSAEAFHIGRKQLYILPTRIGWYFALILLALFGIAVKFDNQAAFMMLFILVGLGNAVMYATHQNVVRLSIEGTTEYPCFAGQEARIDIRLRNPDARQRRAIYATSGEFTTQFQLEPDSTGTITLRIHFPTRGRYIPSDLILSSQFPAGLFFCWTKRYRFSNPVYVYPTPINHVAKQNSLGVESESESSSSQQISRGDFRGLRQYIDGDRLRDVHWPALAKTQKLAVKEYETQTIDEYDFNYDALPSWLSVEDKLSQLAFWIERAAQLDNRYSLTLPGKKIKRNQGAAHKHRCLASLAVFSLPNASAEHTKNSARKYSWWQRLKGQR